MSQKISGKIKVEGTLTAVTPLSVGGLGTGEHVDLELAEDGTGQCYVPGTSLAGPMRSWLERRLPQGSELSNSIFGYINQKGDGGKASLIYISDSPIANAVKERRHGISIQDSTDTSLTGAFYTRALLPKGTQLKLKIELDIIKKNYPDGHPAGALALILEALCAGKIRFGACKTRGMGEMKLEDLKLNFYDFAGDDTALDLWLDGQDARKHGIDALNEFARPSLKPERTFVISIPWRPVSPLMVKSGRDGIEADMLPLTSGVDDANIAPVIPGSSLKGIFRYQARKILNTLFEFDAKYNVDENPIIEDLFGSKNRAGRLMIDDVYYQKSVDHEGWLTEDVASLNSVTERHQHTAIDRFTGGASERALYSARPVNNMAGWEPIRMTLDESNAVSDENIKKEQALIKLLLRDFKDGYMPVGFGSRRGLGEIETGDIDYGAEFPDDFELQPAWDGFISSGGKNFDVKIIDKDGQAAVSTANGDE